MSKVLKKSMVALYTILTENANRKVSSIMAEIEPFFYAKASGAGTGVPHEQATLKDADGNVVAIRCYYFKRWMPLVGDLAVEVGSKANSATGLNTMCKEGVNLWTKQNRDAKTALDNLLKRVEAGEVSPTGISDEKAKIEEDRKHIAETDKGFASLDEVIAYLTEAGVAFNAEEADVESADESHSEE